MVKYIQLKVLITTMLLMSVLSYAQTTVTGTITDESGEPIVGATVLQENTTNGTITDINGQFQLSVPTSSTLVISFVGMKTMRIRLNGRTSLNITLKEDLTQLDEVIVNALGLEENNDEIGYANSTIGKEDIDRAKESSLINSLSGKLSGVRITRNSGDPGAGAFIQIRGISSLNGAVQPLIVLDGVPIDNSTRGNGAGRIAQQSRLNDINPNDIENITVLKGAPAAALWGTQALGGVIMITTKSGKFNQGLRVSVKSTYSVDVINRKYPLQTTFGQGDNGVYNQRARDSWGDKISERSGGQDDFNTAGEFFIGQNGNIYYPIINKNDRTIYDDANFDQIFQNGHFWENNISLSAGNEKGNVFVSLSDMDQQGIIRNNSDYRRTTIRVNTEYLLNDKLTWKSRSSYAKTSSNRIRRGASSSGLYLGLLRTPADFDNTGYRGDFYSGPDASPIPNRHRSYREPIAADATPTYNNPLWTINEQQDLAVVDRYVNTFEMTYSPKSWLDVVSRVGIDHYSESRDEFYTPGSAAGEFRPGFFSSELATNTIFNLNTFAKGQFDITPSITVTPILGINYTGSKRRIDGSEINSFIQFTDVASGLRDIDNALPENRVVTSFFGEDRLASVYTSVSVSFGEELFLNGTLRSETASTFGEAADNTFMFPSASLAWQFTDRFELPGLSFGKFRLSYGEVGTQPPRYQTNNNYVAPTYGDEYGGDLAVALYGNGGFVPSVSLGNTALVPERKKEFEVGMDLRFLSDRLSFKGTYFNNTTESLFIEQPVANSRGYDNIFANAAEIQNKGTEMDLGYDLIRTQDLVWNVSLIYTQVRNEVTDLAGAETVNFGGLAAVNSRAVEGLPLGVLWGSRTLRDDGGNIVFDANGFPVQDEREGVIGDPNPDWQGSAITSLSYKGLSLSVLLETFQGADIYAGTKSVLYDLGRWEDSAIESTFSQNLLDYDGNVIPAGTTFRGVVEDFGAGPVALTEPWYNADGGFFGSGNDELYIEDGSWTRIREIALSYNLNSPWLQSKGINSVLLTATGRNLFLWTEFEGNDPDTNFSGVSVARGIDYFNNPGTKSYVFSVEINF